MIGDYDPIERAAQLGPQSGGRLDLLAPGKTVGIGMAENVPEQSCIER